jgi:fumarylacetoacetate (FAA) hydrolase family protein
MGLENHAVMQGSSAMQNVSHHQQQLPAWLCMEKKKKPTSTILFARL